MRGSTGTTAGPLYIDGNDYTNQIIYYQLNVLELNK